MATRFRLPTDNWLFRETNRNPESLSDSLEFFFISPEFIIESWKVGRAKCMEIREIILEEVARQVIKTTYYVRYVFRLLTFFLLLLLFNLYFTICPVGRLVKFF